jgi:hypothetical protein
VFNSIIDQGDSARFAVVQLVAPAGVARDVALVFSESANRRLAAVESAAKLPGKKGRAEFGCTMMPALRDVVADHFADRFCPFPTHTAFMRV